METKAKFKVIYMDEAVRFLESLDEKVRTKIAYNIEKAMLVVDKALFKKMGSSDIWEFRTLYNGMSYRLFAFWDTDKETLVVATHGLIKKTQRTPFKEILKAEELRKLYFGLKKK
ncbi:type II toxin-antitoxin system RelE/ParE family toxin [Parabacteroides sp.]